MNIIKLTENTEVCLAYIMLIFRKKYKPTTKLRDINCNRMRTNLPEKTSLPEQVDNTKCHVART